MLALLGLLMMGCCLLSACSASVENTPEGVATFVVNSYMKGKYPDTREYATQDVMKDLDKWTQESTEKVLKIYGGTEVEFDKVSDFAADGSMKDVFFNIRIGEKKRRMSVRMVNENGKWLFDGLQLC